MPNKINWIHDLDSTQQQQSLLLLDIISHVEFLNELWSLPLIRLAVCIFVLVLSTQTLHLRSSL